MNRTNIRDFCSNSWLGQTQDSEIGDSCARVNAVLVPRKDSKSHLRGEERISENKYVLSNDFCSSSSKSDE